MAKNSSKIGKRKPTARKKKVAVNSGVLPRSYRKVLEALKDRIRSSQVKAAIAVNRELIQLYWHIGKEIVDRQEKEGWGKSIIERLAADLQAAFPGVGGFSKRNVWRMRSLYVAYTKEVTILPQPVAELDGVNLPQAVAEIPRKFKA